MDLWLIGELAITGALVGLMYALVAVGIVLVYKTSSVANFAQGAIAMTGSYVAWAFATLMGAPLWVAIPLALVTMFGLGFVIERAVLRHMVGQPIIMIIMVTFGMEIFLRGMMPGFFGVAVKRLDLGIPQAPMFLGEMLINRAYLIGGITSAVLIVGTIVLFNSRAGIIMRAVSDDQGASWSVGIRVERAIAIAWGLAAGTATAAGILWGSTQGVDWSLSLLLMKALAIAILGGLDSIPGVLLAGVIVGVCESLATGIVDPLVGGGTRDIVASLIILMTLLVRPYGLFGREQIERV
ncbi:branched-chain amino acid ABC transporter permease [Bradyrhizobium sp. LHD-71]|uniref:branched-chain amino acid ABC transporter permease n=1 Tax=Bradyrhizobium sp. LHD-71 TaxID=3072141 RepID=UPI00280DD78F|nr:branched-chain amino acid ABC transporter permease [Bradyrhizobium sp. LHD-71]MDQ8727475.1 branched-chain amino acid ABC transporter permease [Bradyrhizobium sp. LHD-71]